MNKNMQMTFPCSCNNEHRIYFALQFVTFCLKICDTLRLQSVLG